METPPEKKPFWMAPFAMHASRGLIRDQNARRKMMVVAVAGALLLMIGGSSFLQGLLDPREHTVAFILYWLACAWLTILALLLALFDLLIVRSQARAARRVLRGEIATRPTPDSPSESRDG